MGFWVWVIVAVLLIVLVGAVIESSETAKREINHAKHRGVSSSDVLKWGALNDQMICPHCQKKGRVMAKSIQVKKGISGAKVAGAMLTGGASLMATGISRKEASTQAHCANCSSTWYI